MIPTLVSHRLAEGNDLTTAFRNTVASFEGSVAIAANAAAEPDKLLLALRGAARPCVGLADGAYIVASEPYGVIELTDRYLRMDGETPANPDNPTASRGQIVVLDGSRAGTFEGIDRLAYDGTPLPVTEADIATAQITTRDIDRGQFPHFLLKEISEAPTSLQDAAGQADRAAGDGAGRPTRRAAGRREAGSATARSTGGVIGQGTAAVAGAMAAGLDQFCGSTNLKVDGAGHRAVRVRAAAVDVGHVGGRHQPVGHHHRHQPHGRPGPVARAKVVAIVNRRQRPHRQGRRCCTRRTSTSRCPSPPPRPSTARSPQACCWRQRSATRSAVVSTRPCSAHCATCPMRWPR